MDRISALAEQHGWTQDTMYSLARQWMEESKNESAFVAFLEKVAAGEKDDDTDEEYDSEEEDGPTNDG